MNPVCGQTMRLLALLLSCVLLAQAARIKRQSSRAPVVCTACTQRAIDSPNMACCRCQDQGSFCNNDVGSPGENLLPVEDFPIRAAPSLSPGLVEDFGDFEDSEYSDIFTRQAGRPEASGCPAGQELCCNPVPGDILEVRLGLLASTDPLGDFASGGSPRVGEELPICERPELAAVINFNFGIACGKRDSRVYHQARRSRVEGGEGEVTNPGEWPWAVLIFNGDTYVGSGALLDNDMVVTTATKVQKYLDDPGALSVRMGDFDPNVEGGGMEDFPHVEAEVICVRLHPKAQYPNGLLYNVAVLKLRVQKRRSSSMSTAAVASAVSVVDIRSAPRRPANRPNGVDGFRRNEEIEDQLSSSGVSVRQAGGDLRAGLLSALNNEVDPLGQPVGGEVFSEPLEVDSFIPRSYINTVCIPDSPRKFPPGTRCWVAAWGAGLREQREIRLPLVDNAECERRLRPEFASRGVPNWNLDSTELCAGGEVGVDSCEGEGGAPLVCLDEDTDQFFAIGLVGYGFGCGEAIPAVYTNLADPEIQSFIESAFGPNFC